MAHRLPGSRLPPGFRPERIGAKVLTVRISTARESKIPVVFIIGGMYYMILSYATQPVVKDEDKLRSMTILPDVYNTGVCKVQYRFSD